MIPAERSSPPHSPNASSSRRLTVGAQLGPYQLLEALGQGAMGAVFRARDARFEREVAIKVILERKLSDRARERFSREATALGALRHPAITAVHDLGEDGGRLYLVLELIPGARPLQVVLQHLGRTEVVELLLEVARALGHAHAHGIVHRDVKPSNILVDAKNRPYLTDFGLVTGDRFAHLARLTQSKAIVGTPIYMSPEQVSGERGQLSPASDVWSLGVVLYEALTGERPFDEDSLQGLMIQIAQARYVRPRRVDRTISPALARVVERALQREPARRYLNGEAMAEALAAALLQPDSRGGMIRRSGPVVAAIALGGLGLAGAVSLTSSTSPATSSTPTATHASPLPSSPETWITTADRLQEAGDTQGALDALTQALSVDPDDPTLWIRRSELHQKAGQLDEALWDARQALEFRGGSPAAWQALAVAQLADDQFDEAIVSSLHVVEARPDWLEAWLIRGEALRLGGRLEEAHQACERAMDIDRDSPSAMNNMAIVLQEMGQLARAQRLLLRVTQIDPTAAAPWRNLAAVQFTQGQLASATATLDRGIERVPDASLYELRARLRQKDQDLSGALEDFNEALRLQPKQVDSLLLRGALLQKLGLTSRARTDAERALRAGPSYLEQWNALYTLCWQVGENAMAKRALEGVLRLDDQNARAWNTLAMLKEEQGDVDGALADYDRAVGLDRNDAEIRFNRGELHYQLGNATEAIRDLRLAKRFLDRGETKALAQVESLLAELEAALEDPVRR